MKHYKLLQWLLLTLLAVPFVSGSLKAQDQEGASRLEVDDYLDWEFVQNPQLSPDATQLVYVREWIDKINDRHASEVWIMDADGSRNRFLLEGSSPAWSPDGTRIAFVKEGEPQGAQIFVRWMDAEGAVSQVTRLTESPSSIQWSPNSNWLAFNVLDKAPMDPAWQIDMPQRPEGADWTAPPRIVEKLNYRRDGSGWSPIGSRHIYIVSSSGGTARRLTSGNFDHGAPRWMPDGQTILFSGLRAEDAEYQYRESALYSVNVTSGDIQQITDRRGSETNPLPSPDGSLIAYQGNEFTMDTYTERELYVMSANSSGSRVVAREMGGVANVTWAADGSGLYYTASMKGTSNLWFAPLNGDPRRVTEGNHMLSTTDIADNSLAVGIRTSYYEPGSLVAYSLQAPGEIRVLKGTNEAVLSQVELGEVEEIWYKSVDGLDIQGWINKPPEFDSSKKYPMILRIQLKFYGIIT